MTENNNINSAQKEEQLRTLFAMNRGIELLEELQSEYSKTRGHYAALRTGYLEELFHRVHRDLFADWQGVDPEQTEEEKKAFAHKRIELRQIISDIFFSKSEDGTPTGLFDQNGFVVRAKEGLAGRKKLAELLTNFYEKAREIEPYSYGNKLTLDFFMVALSKLPAFAEVYPEGIDFRRLDINNLKALEKIDGKRPSHDAIKAAFMKATDPSIVHPLMNLPKSANTDPQKAGYTVWEDKTIMVGGVPFLSTEHKGQTCLVTVNGGLVQKNTIEQKLTDFLENGGLIANFGVQKSDIVGYLEGTKELQNKKIIDGNKITDDKVPLLCLDMNIMTGLRPATNDEFIEFFKKVKGDKAKITDLNKQPHIKEELLVAANGNDRLREAIEIAYERININVPRMDAILDDGIFKNAKSSEHPKMYMSMGGSGSGKSSVDKIAETECGTKGYDFVASSLDDFRNYSDLHKVLIASHHHADDYAIIDPFALALREWVNERAKSKKINLLIDGSGIDYKGRNDQIVKDFKDSGYTTQVIAVETYYPNAIERVNGRYEEKNRAMPWVRVADKHMRFPLSFLDAVADKNADKVSMVCSDDINNNYIIAETFYKSKSAIDELKTAKKTGLLETIKGFFEDPKSILRLLGADFPNNTPNMNNDNITYLKYNTIKNTNDEKRILAVYDSPRLMGLMEKGLMNPNSSSLDKTTLYHTPDTMPFNMPEASNDANYTAGAWQQRFKNQPKQVRQVS